METRSRPGTVTVEAVNVNQVTGNLDFEDTAEYDGDRGSMGFNPATVANTVEGQGVRGPMVDDNQLQDAEVGVGTSVRLRFLDSGGDVAVTTLMECLRPAGKSPCYTGDGEWIVL